MGVELGRGGINFLESTRAELKRAFASLGNTSRERAHEVAGEACLGKADGLVKRVIVHNVGDSRSSSLRPESACPVDEFGIAFHTHPTSGSPLPSQQDVSTFAARIKGKIDAGHCIIGREEALCITGTFVRTADP